VADEVDQLYDLPLEEFTGARNELSKRLGDPEVKKLKKPSVSAWAVNQLARGREVDLRRLLRAGEQLEEAQKDAVRGGDQAPFEKARREERDAVRALRTAAGAVLRSGGHPASDATLERVARSLRAGAASEEGRRALREGRLTDDLEATGFEALAAVAGTPSSGRRRPAGKAKTPSAADRRRARKAREEADEARRAANEAAGRLAEAERSLRNAERELERAGRAAETAADKAKRLEARAAELAV
jgi:hypothetical protein